MSRSAPAMFAPLTCAGLAFAGLLAAVDAHAQLPTRAPATFELPRDFGRPSVGEDIGFEECDSTPSGGRYICDEIVLKNGERVLFTEPLDIEVRDDFQLEEGTSFNPDCFVTRIFVTNNKGFVLKKNGSFNGNLEVDKTVKIEENGVLNGDAISFEPNFDIVSPGRINGTCSDGSGPVSVPGCGGVSQCAVPLSLEKSASATIVAPGDELTYTLDFANEGDREVLNATVTDEVPANTTFVSATGGPDSTPPVGGTGTITWSGDLSVGEASSVSVTVQVDGSTANGTVLTNDAQLTAAGAGTETASVDALVQSQPLLSLGNSADVVLVDPGGQITYTLTVSNIGNATATNPVLVSNLDPDTEFVSATGGGVEISPGMVEWSAAEIQAGSQTSVTVTVRVLVATPRGTILNNQGRVESDQTSVIQDNALVLVDERPLLVLNKSADAEVVEAGDTLTFTLDYGNDGSLIAENVSLADTLPTNTVFLSATGGGIESSPGVVTWDSSVIGDLNPGDEGSVQVTVQVASPLADGTRLINRSNLIDGNGARVAYSEVTVTVNSRPVLSLFKESPQAIVEPGDVINYAILAVNTGNAVASNLTLEDAIPENTSFLSASSGGTESDGVVTWSLAELPVNQPRVFLLSVQVASPLADQTTLFNTASLTGGTQAVTAEFVSTVRSEAVLELEKRAVDLQDPLVDLEIVEPGEEVGYAITVRNVGNAIADNLLIEDPIPENTTFVDASDGGLLVDGKVVWRIDSLAPGTQVQVGFAVLVASPLDDGTRIYNVATADADATRAATADAELFVDSSPVLALEKSVDKSVANPGDLLTYRLIVRNTGNANALNPVLEDRIPANTSFVTASGPYTVSDDVVRWTVPSLNAGASGAVTLTVRVDSPLADGTTIDNSALLNADNAPSVTDEASTQIDSSPVLTLRKAADAERVQPGDELTYLLTLENIGNAIALNVALADRVPQGTTFVSASGGGVENSGIVTWPAADLSPGPVASVSMTVRVNDPLDNGTIIANSAIAGSDNSPEVAASVEVLVDSAPVLTLDKAADKTRVSPGDELTYTLSVGAAGNAIARNAQILDFLPRNTTLVDAPGASVSGRRIVWALGDLAPGDSRSVSFVVRADTPLDDRVIIRNLAAITADNADSRIAFTRTDVDSSPELSVTKTPSTDFVTPGQQYSYTLSYTNTGNANALMTTLEDTVPDNTSFVSATGGGTLQGDQVVWDLGSLQALTSGQVTATFQVAGPPVSDGTIIDNTVTLAAGNAPSVTDDARVIVQSEPSLALEKTVDKSKVAPGETLTYIISGSNGGNDTARSVVFEDPLPANTSFVSATGGGALAGGVVSWNVGDLLPGAESSVSFTVAVDSPLDNGTVIKNTGAMRASNAVSVTASVTSTVISSADLEIEKTVDAAVVEPGANLTYTILYRNIGNANAANVDLVDILPDNTSFVSATGSPTAVGKTTTWDIGDLVAGDEGTITLVVRVDSPLDNGTRITNTSVISAPGTDFDQDSVTSVVNSEPRLALRKSSSAAIVEPGDEITYTLDLSNTGNAIARNISLTDQIPQFTQFVSASPGAVFDGGFVTWSFPSLIPDDPASVTLTVRVDTPLSDGTTIDNIASAAAVNAEGVSAKVSSLVESSPLLTLSKSPDREKVEPGSELTYRFAYANNGNDAATDVILEDTVPSFTRFVAASDGGTESRGIVTWKLGEVPAGGTGEVTATFLVDGPSLPDGTRIRNVATVNAADTVAATDAAEVIVSSAPFLTLSKSVDRPFAVPGDQITFTIEFANKGSDSADDVVLTDTLPENTSLLFVSGEPTRIGDTLTWNFATLEPGVPGAITLVLGVDSPLADGTTLVNTAGLQSNDTKPVSDTATVQIRSLPLLELSKTADVSAVMPGDPVTYTLRYANRGTDAAQSTVLVDTLPSNVRFLSASPPATVTGNTVRWAIGQLLADSEGEVTLTVAVDGDVSDGDAVLNSGLLDAVNGTAVSASLSLPVSARPVLSVTKSADKEYAVAGESINYVIAYDNLGNGAASGATITDVLPGNVSFVSAPGAVVTGSTVSWDLDTLAPGASGSLSLEVAVDGVAQAGDLVVNRASISAVETPPVVSDDAVVTVIDSATPPILDVSIDGAPTQVRAGAQITYTVGYANSSTGTADEPRLAALVPEGTEFVSASDGGVLRTEGTARYVEWSVPALPGDVSGTVTYVVRTLAGGDTRRIISSGAGPASRDLYRPGTTVAPQNLGTGDPSSVDTQRPLLAVAAIYADNFSPPQVASTVVFLTISNLDPKNVPIASRWQLLLAAMVLLAVGVRRFSRSSRPA